MPAFNSVTAAEAGRKGRGACGKGKRQSPRSQVIELQTLAMASASHKDTPVSVQAALMRAYVDLQEMRMALEGIGKPRPVIAKNDQAKTRKPKLVAPLPRKTEGQGSSVSVPGTTPDPSSQTQDPKHA